jgi:hypothetical protein
MKDSSFKDKVKDMHLPAEIIAASIVRPWDSRSNLLPKRHSSPYYNSLIERAGVSGTIIGARLVLKKQPQQQQHKKNNMIS